jgi:pimeloyl-ACP methyl ester carboxylesterase
MGISAAEASDLFRQAPHEYIRADVGEVAHRVVGSGPHVLFVHGWPLSGATFRALLPHLVDHVTCHVIDLPGAGSSRFHPGDDLTIANHVRSVVRVIDHLGLSDIAVVGHDSGGIIARHAIAGDRRVRALGLLDTEQAARQHWKFRSFVAARRLPGFGAALGWVAGKPALRRNPFVLGDAFFDRSLLDGEFDEFFLQPLHRSPEYRAATMRLFKSFDYSMVHALADLHRRIDVPVQLVWGEHDRFFPVDWARTMVDEFSNASLAVIPEAGLCVHEERPAEVAAALLPVLSGRS